MGRIRREEENYDRKYRKPTENRLTESELSKLDEELKEYRSGGYNTVNEKKWLISRGAFSKDGKVIIRDFDPAQYYPNGPLKKPCDCEPILFEQLSADLEQYYDWKGRKEYGEKRRLEGLDQLASTLTIPPEYKN